MQEVWSVPQAPLPCSPHSLIYQSFIYHNWQWIPPWSPLFDSTSHVLHSLCVGSTSAQHTSAHRSPLRSPLRLCLSRAKYAGSKRKEQNKEEKQAAWNCTQVHFKSLSGGIILDTLSLLPKNLPWVTGKGTKLCHSSWGGAASEIHLSPSPLPEGRIKTHLRVCSSIFSSKSDFSPSINYMC